MPPPTPSELLQMLLGVVMGVVQVGLFALVVGYAIKKSIWPSQPPNRLAGD